MSPQDYIRLFQVKASDKVLFLDCALEAYQSLNALIVIWQDEYTIFLPKQTIERTTKEGHGLYEDEEAYGEYERDFLGFLERSELFLEEMLAKGGMAEGDVRSVAELIKTFFTFYSKTEFFYTDGPYRRALERNDVAVLGRLKRLDAIKFKGREAMNRFFFLSGNVVSHMTEKLAFQFGLAPAVVSLSTLSELSGMFRGDIPSQDITQRNASYVLMAENGLRKRLDEKKRQEIAEAFAVSLAEAQETIVKGTVACRGKVTGRVKVFPPLYGQMEKLMAEVANMEQGQIMVAETTSPDIVAGCRKAGAIVTNQGGLMSHAAVVAREFNIPCIVGTGNATKVLHDGDEVEVDAEKGIVTVL